MKVERSKPENVIYEKVEVGEKWRKGQSRLLCGVPDRDIFLLIPASEWKKRISNLSSPLFLKLLLPLTPLNSVSSHFTCESNEFLRCSSRLWINYSGREPSSVRWNAFRGWKSILYRGAACQNFILNRMGGKCFGVQEDWGEYNILLMFRACLGTYYIYLFEMHYGRLKLHFPWISI